MENNQNDANTHVTRADLKAEFGKFEEKMEQLLSEQANVILEAVGELMGEKLDEKFDPVMTKLDGIVKGVEARFRSKRPQLTWSFFSFTAFFE